MLLTIIIGYRAYKSGPAQMTSADGWIMMEPGDDPRFPQDGLGLQEMGDGRFEGKM
jgi:hypothetical protein